MTTYTSSNFSKSAWGSATDADFRAWGSACQAAIAGCGLTQVSSATDWATTTIPAVAGTYNANDTATYKFNDGRTEIYIKFEWGRGSATANAVNQFSMRVQIGLDAAMAQSTANGYITSGCVAAAITDYAWSASFSDGSFVLTEVSGSFGATYCPAFIAVERSRGITGSINNEACILMLTGNSNTSLTPQSASNAGMVNRRLVFSPFAYLSGNGSIAHLASTSLTAISSGVDAVVPPVWGYNGKLTPMRGVLIGPSATILTFQNVSINDGGVTRSYRTNSMPGGSSPSTSSAYRVMYRWE